jgi:Uma2 family endonuclease
MLCYLHEVSSQAPKRAGYDDVLAAPPHVIAEVLEGTLYTQPRPAMRHAVVSSELGVELGAAFGRRRGGPGGWILLYEPELHLGPGPDILAPDFAGWRLTTLAEVPDVPYLTVAPDWVCEVLSPSTRRIDRVVKMPIYRRERVQHVWLIDPEAKTLEVFRLDGESYRLIDTFAEDARVRAEPFDAIELELGALWLR